ncbi:SusD/RagB family nutrient-binding outer membrane lipoprotein [Parapedobacter lycopersici]|uniref:SusD/RagB family nutrient-binding outer membrane lipoprotein n=1 Tax=Parapedobacter lycopersici TaxID=1864939 RepID=UPI00214DA02E|nr:SusD/RagB family nutrient-binding outer membrane lipoprotein [Parapedobacter lycopersici]
MKRKLTFIIVALLVSVNISCDKDFEKINTNPSLANELNPEYLFSNAQRLSAAPSYHYEGEIVQHINTPYGGVLAAGNRNIINDQHSNALFNTMYTDPIRYLTEVINKTRENPAASNLHHMARIWKAYCFQRLVDTYGDVPYSEAALGYTDGNFLPKYDASEVVYDAIIQEYITATDALDPAQGTIGAADLFYGGNIEQWKRLGNSLLLRIGMRFTKIDAARAESLVAQAVDPARGGVMVSNADNAYIQLNEIFTNSTSNALLAGERANYYVGEAFVNFLRNNHDPRLRLIAVKYENPSNPLATAGAANTNPEDQQGMPYGYDESAIEDAPGFPGKIGSAFKYSQFNRATVMRIDAPEYLVSYSQTLLLLAEANYRGYVSTGDPADYYADAIAAHMAQDDLYGTPLNVSPSELEDYLNEPNIAFDPARALEQINVQYWVSSFRNWGEGWANFRRSGYPTLTPINFPSQDPSVTNGDGFIHRLVYPLREVSVNSANVQEAIGRMGGDNLGNRVFWDQ